MMGVSSSSTGRSSARLSLVSAADSIIHHWPLILMKLRPTSKAAKSLRRIGQNASNATISPFRKFDRFVLPEVLIEAGLTANQPRGLPSGEAKAA
jgi:hypothetical protein